MAEPFPSSLSELLNVSGFSHEIGDTTLRSSMSVGLEKVRRRFTKGIDLFSCSINIDFDDYTTLYNFYDVTLNGGVNTFNYTHPLTQVESEFRFVAPPKISPLGGRYFNVSMTWEEIP